VFFNKYVHELVTIDTDFIHARFNYETYTPSSASINEPKPSEANPQSSFLSGTLHKSSRTCELRESVWSIGIMVPLILNFET
jgi:hypothetical protein